MHDGKSVAFPKFEPGAVFHALSDVTRLRLVQLLLLEELNVTELVDILGLPQSSVSRQLKVLRDVGLVQDRRVGGHLTLFGGALCHGCCTRWIADPPLDELAGATAIAGGHARSVAARRESAGRTGTGVLQSNRPAMG
ncbi:MAG: helix-turn-helix transcriptional regulator [Planctomycetes bacterium]|nr:helix-turn-helix transcriptional regulator [Planctomycetota bacterium]